MRKRRGYFDDKNFQKIVDNFYDVLYNSLARDIIRGHALVKK